MAHVDEIALLRTQIERGRPAVFAQHDPQATRLVDAVTDMAAPFSVGAYVAEDASTPVDALEMIRSIANPVLLTDFDVLFHPAMRTDVIALLRQIGRRTLLIAAWPGSIRNSRLIYSTPGRHDYIDEPANGFVILHPRPTTFPDEVPFTLEITRP